MSVGFTKPLGERFPARRLRFCCALCAAFSSRVARFSSARALLRRAEIPVWVAEAVCASLQLCSEPQLIVGMIVALPLRLVQWLALGQVLEELQLHSPEVVFDFEAAVLAATFLLFEAGVFVDGLGHLIIYCNNTFKHINALNYFTCAKC